MDQISETKTQEMDFVLWKRDYISSFVDHMTEYFAPQLKRPIYFETNLSEACSKFDKEVEEEEYVKKIKKECTLETDISELMTIDWDPYDNFAHYIFDELIEIFGKKSDEDMAFFAENFIDNYLRRWVLESNKIEKKKDQNPKNKNGLKSSVK